ncbi:hypothetical protein IIA29_07075 [candidate division KSB1 bacterium]|nr:hypothetical protein [candidate division KSB1 bacterium]
MSPDFTEIEWQLGLGNDGSPRNDFEWEDPADRFYRAHTATQLPNGNLLVFDNGATAFLKIFIPPEDESVEFFEEMISLMSRRSR